MQHVSTYNSHFQAKLRTPTTQPTPTESYKAEQQLPTSSSFAQATYLTLRIIP